MIINLAVCSCLAMYLNQAVEVQAELCAFVNSVNQGVSRGKCMHINMYFI